MLAWFCLCVLNIIIYLLAVGAHPPPSPSFYPCDWNTLSVFQQMQSNADHLVNHQVEMQEMRKLIQFQQEQYKLSSRLFGTK